MEQQTTVTSETLQLGMRYRDRITQFEGIATVKTESLFGETRVLLEGPGEKKQAIGDGYFSVQRLQPVEGEIIDISELQREGSLTSH